MRKQSIYNNIDLEDVKTELQRNINYIDSIDILDLDDEIEIDYSSYGTNCIQVIERLEDKLTSLIILIKNSIEQLKYITDLSEADEFVEGSFIALTEAINIMVKYYDERPPELLENRVYELVRKKKNGDSYTVKKTIANISRQIKSRSTVQKIILQLKPLISNLQEKREDQVLLKGNKQIPVALQLHARIQQGK